MPYCNQKRLPSSDELEDEDPNSTMKNAPEKGYLNLTISGTEKQSTKIISSAALRDQLRAMHHEEFTVLIRKVYGALEGGIHEIQVQNTIQQDLLDELL